MILEGTERGKNTSSLSRAGAGNFALNFGNKKEEELKTETPIFKTAREKAQQKRSDAIFNVYNEGNEYLMTDTGRDDLAKMFTNRLRSTSGKAVNDLVYFLGDQIEDNESEESLPDKLSKHFKSVYYDDKSGTRDIYETAEKQAQNAKDDITNINKARSEIVYNALDSLAEKNSNSVVAKTRGLWEGIKSDEFNRFLGENIVNAIDSIATQYSYRLLPGGTKHLALFMGVGGGVDTYVKMRESGSSKSEALARAVTDGGISYAIESLGGIGKANNPLTRAAGKLGGKINDIPFIDKIANSKAMQSFLGNVVKSAVEEGGEELLEYSVNTLANSMIDLLYHGENRQEWDWKEFISNGFTGALAGGIQSFAMQNPVTNRLYSETELSEINRVANDIGKVIANDVKNKQADMLDPNAQKAEPIDKDDIAIKEFVENNARTEQSEQTPTQNEQILEQIEQAQAQEEQIANAQNANILQEQEEVNAQEEAIAENLAREEQINAEEQQINAEMQEIEQEMRAQEEKAMTDQLVVPKEGQQAEKSDFAIENGEITAYNDRRKKKYAIVAPYTNTELTNGNENELIAKTYNPMENSANYISKKLGIEVPNISINRGGYTFSSGDRAGQHTKELSYTFEFNGGATDDIVRFTTLMGDIAFEQQEAVIVKEYVKNRDDGDAFEINIGFKNISYEAVEDILASVGIGDYTINKKFNTIELLDFSSQLDQTAMDKFNKIKNILGGSYNDGTSSFDAIRSSYLDGETRTGIYRSWLKEGQQSRNFGDILWDAKGRAERLAQTGEITNNPIKTDETAVNNDGFSNAENSETHPNTVGAMESDPTSYSYMQNNYGTHMPGENPTRVVDVPLSTDGTDKVSRGAQNIEEGGATPDVMIGYYDEAVRTGKFSYNVVTDEKSLNYAKDTVTENGFKQSVAIFKNAVKANHGALTKEQLTLGFVLLATAQKSVTKGVKGARDVSIELASDCALAGTIAGQTVQGMRIYKQLGPDVVKQYYDKLLEHVNNSEFVKTHLKKGVTELTLPENLNERIETLDSEYQKAKTPEEKKAVEEKLEQFESEVIGELSSQLRGKFSEKFDKIRYFSMINENFNKEAEPQIFKIGEKIYYAWYIGEEDDKIFYKTVDGEKICFPSERIEEAFVFEPKKAEKTVEEKPPKKAEEKPKAPAKKKK